MTFPRRLWLLLIPAVLATAVGLTMASRGQAQDSPNTTYVKVTIGGAEVPGHFRTVTVKGGGTNVVTHTSTDENGTSLVQASPGRRHHWTITLARDLDADAGFHQWYRDVLDGEIATSRENGTLEILDWQGGTVATYAFTRAWPRHYKPPVLKSGSDAPLVETLTLVAEGFKRE